MKRKAFIRIRILIGMALISSFSTTSYAEFNLDKLKSLAEQAKAYQEKLKQSSPSNVPAPTGPSAQASSDTALTSETPGGNATQVGPNILGIRLGMTPNEARKILDTRPGIKVREVRGVLMYQPASGSRKPIPNSGYVKELNTFPAPVTTEAILVTFTPTAGRERVISVERRQTFPAGQQPTIDATVEALVEKYGPFSYKRKPNPLGVFIEYFWRFDSSTRLLNANTGTVGAESDVCANPARAALGATPLNFSPLSIKVFQDLLTKYEKCGQPQVFARLDTGGARADAPLVRSLSVSLSGWVEAVAARRDVDRFVENYGKGEAGKEIREADKRRLDL